MLLGCNVSSTAADLYERPCCASLAYCAESKRLEVLSLVLELVLSCVQGVKHFKDIRYTATLTYGEMLLQNEYEMSCYNLDNAHVPSQQQLFELHKKVRTLQASPCFVPMCQRSKYM